MSRPNQGKSADIQEVYVIRETEYLPTSSQAAYVVEPPPTDYGYLAKDGVDYPVQYPAPAQPVVTTRSDWSGDFLRACCAALCCCCLLDACFLKWDRCIEDKALLMIHGHRFPSTKIMVVDAPVPRRTAKANLQ